MVQKPEKALTAKAVGREFVRQYYTMLAKEPKYLHRFYGSNSEMLHGAKEDQVPAVGQVKIREKIKALCFRDCHTKVAQLDAFITIGNGIVIQVAGEISNNQQPLRRFMQTFVLGPQDREGADPGTSFYVHNDIFRYQDDIFDDVLETGNGDNELSASKMEVNGGYNNESNVVADNGDAIHASPPTQTSVVHQSAVVPQVQPQAAVVSPQQQQQQQQLVQQQQYMQQMQPVAMQQQAPPPTQQMPVVAAPVAVVEENNQVETSQYEEINKDSQQNEYKTHNSNNAVEEVTSATESLSVKEEAASVEEVKEPVERQNLAPVSNAPLSWAARMRSQNAPAMTPSQMPPLQPPTQPKPTKATAPEPVAKSSAPEPSVPSQEGGLTVDEPAQNAAPISSRSSVDRRDQGSREFSSFKSDRRRDHSDRDDFREPRGPRQFSDDRHQIFVGGLPPTMSEEDIRTTFSKFGTVKFVRMNQNTNSRPGAGFGFVTFSSEAEAQNALNERDGIFFNGLQLNIEEKKTKNPSGHSDSRGPRHSGPRDSRDGGHSGRGGSGSRGGGRGGQGGYRSDNQRRPDNRGNGDSRGNGNGPEKYGRRERAPRQNY